MDETDACVASIILSREAGLLTVCKRVQQWQCCYQSRASRETLFSFFSTFATWGLLGSRGEDCYRFCGNPWKLNMVQLVRQIVSFQDGVLSCF